MSIPDMAESSNDNTHDTFNFQHFYTGDPWRGYGSNRFDTTQTTSTGGLPAYGQLSTDPLCPLNPVNQGTTLQSASEIYLEMLEYLAEPLPGGVSHPIDIPN